MTTARVRGLLGALGVVAGLYGAWLVLSRQDGFARIADVGVWLVGGALLHDAVIAPVVLLLAWLSRGLPRAWRRAVLVGFVVLGSVTLLAVPVLGRFGARSDNPTLLDRSYGWGWLGLALLVVVLVVVAGVVGSRRDAVQRAAGGDGGPRAGGR